MTVVEGMDPLNDMCEALVSITDILRRRRQTNGNATSPSDCAEKYPREEEEASTVLPSGEPSGTRNQTHNDRLHSEPLTEENFHRAHLLNRSIDELPSKAIRGHAGSLIESATRERSPAFPLTLLACRKGDRCSKQSGIKLLRHVGGTS